METKNKIIGTAFKLFAKNGTNFSLTQIADEVGIKKASIYAHFENKEMLILHMIDQEIEKYFFEIYQKRSDLKSIFFSFLDYYDLNSNLDKDKLLFWKRLLLFPPETLDKDIINNIHVFSDERFDVVKKLIQRDIDAGKIKRSSSEEIALTFFSLIHGLLSSLLIYHPKNPAQHFESIWENFWIGINN